MKKFMMVGAFVALAALTCNKKNIVINGDGPPLSGKTPQEVLRLLEYSFNTRDVESLKECLSEDFVFYVDPEEFDRRGGALPSSMSYDGFWRTAQNMFERAHGISFAINLAGVGVPDPEQTTYRAENTPVRLLVLVTENGGFLAEGSAGFEFEKYQNHAGQERWRIVKWWDGTLPGEGEGGEAAPQAGIERASVAAILAYFS
jgi:hypothetical protein